MLPRSATHCIGIIGGGAAGLLAAIGAARNGACVTILERQDQPGRRLLASGGGRCNFTHACDTADFLAAFGRQGRFLSHAIGTLGPAKTRELLDALGVPSRAETDGRVFPTSGRANDVLAALLAECQRLNVRIETRVAVTGLWIEDGELRGVRLGQDKRPFKQVILACGGCAWSLLGGNRGGLDLARQAGHDIVPPTPALVPLITQDAWPGRLAGVSLSNATVTLAATRHRRSITGDVLFTNRGLSGPAVLNLSADVAALLERQSTVPLELTLPAPLADRPPQDAWASILDQARSRTGKRRVRKLLAEHMPDRLAGELCTLAGLAEDVTAAMLPAAARRKLIALLTAIPLSVVGTEGFGRAMLMRGGVKLRDVEPKTLASRHLGGLFLAGEVLDLDGPTGGYNLQAAFATGYLAGMSAATE